MLPRFSGLTCLLLLLVFSPITVGAQSAATVILSAPDTSAFPRIESYLDVHDTDGQFVHGLKSEHILLLEDDKPVELSNLNELRPGVQFVVALNPGPAMGVQNSQAVSRYDIVKENLREWARSRQGSNIDDWSLLITGGIEGTHISDPTDWLAVLDQDQVDARINTPNLDTLFRALTVAADPPARIGMGRAVLFITSPPESASIPAMENLFSQAHEQGVHIFVWLVSSSGGLETQSAFRLIELAEQTGGSSFNFTGDETLPNIESYLEPKRSIYHLT